MVDPYDLGERIASLETSRAADRITLDRIESKLDKLTGQFSGWGGAVRALLTLAGLSGVIIALLHFFGIGKN